MSMDLDELQRGKAEVIERYGPWTAHNIRLREGLYTMVPGIEGANEFRLRRVVQIISDVTGLPFDQLRVLDLACLEGLFAVELARRGADVVAIEGREANIEKARFAKTALSLHNLELIRDDVRISHASATGDSTSCWRWASSTTSTRLMCSCFSSA